MTFGTALKVAGLVEVILTKNKILDADGNFVQPVDASDIAAAAVEVEELLKGYGLVVDPKFDRVFHTIPGVLGLFGL